MAVERFLYLKTFVWNGVTYNNTTGGTLMLRWGHSASPVADRTGTDEYPTAVEMVNKGLLVFLLMRNVKHTIALGTSSNGVATLERNTGTTQTITFPNLVLQDITPVQSRAVYGESLWTFTHESADGTTVPIS